MFTIDSRCLLAHSGLPVYPPLTGNEERGCEPVLISRSDLKRERSDNDLPVSLSCDKDGDTVWAVSSPHHSNHNPTGSEVLLISNL